MVMEPATDVTCYQICLRDMVRSCRIGCYEQEQRAPQRVRITVILDIAPELVYQGDSLAQFGDAGFCDAKDARFVNYERFLRAIDQILAAGPFALVETLAERILAACFACPQVAAARARVEKLDLVPEACIGVEIARQRPRQWLPSSATTQPSSARSDSGAKQASISAAVTSARLPGRQRG